MRQYGNWRRPITPGFGAMGTTASVGLFVVGISAITAFTFGQAIIGGLLVAVAVVIAIGFAVRDQHYWSVADTVLLWWFWLLRRLKHAHTYRSGPLSRLPDDSYRLPGLAASSVLLPDCEDGLGRVFAVLELPHQEAYSVTMVASPNGDALIDSDQLDQWIEGFSGFLGELATETSIAGASVVIENLHVSGIDQYVRIQSKLAPDAPAVSRQVIDEILDTHTGSYQVRAYITITFTAVTIGGDKRTRDEVVRDIAAALPALTSRLASSGMPEPRLQTYLDRCETVRGMYDPASADIIDRAKAAGERTALTWDKVGPVGTDMPDRGEYAHDSGLSTTWFMTGPPGGRVIGSVLHALLSPHRAIDRKRVCLLYRPVPSDQAAKRVELAKRTLDFEATKTNRPTTRLLHDREKVNVTAQEEAMGAALVEFAMGVTVTVPVEASHRFRDAVAATEQLMGQSRLLMRRCWGMQDAAFLATLPLGVVLKNHYRTW